VDSHSAQRTSVSALEHAIVVRFRQNSKISKLALPLLNITGEPQTVAAVQNKKAVQTLADATAQALPISGSDAS